MTAARRQGGGRWESWAGRRVLGAFGFACTLLLRGKLAVLEAGLKVKADVKLPLQRRRAAASISVEQLGFAGAAGAGSAGSRRGWGCFGGTEPPWLSPGAWPVGFYPPGTGDLSLFCSSSANAN